MINSLTINLVVMEVEKEMDLCREDIDNIRAILERMTAADLMPHQITICPTTSEPCAHDPRVCLAGGCILKIH